MSRFSSVSVNCSASFTIHWAYTYKIDPERKKKRGGFFFFECLKRSFGTVLQNQWELLNRWLHQCGGLPHTSNFLRKHILLKCCIKTRQSGSCLIFRYSSGWDRRIRIVGSRPTGATEQALSSKQQHRQHKCIKRAKKECQIRLPLSNSLSAPQSYSSSPPKCTVKIKTISVTSPYPHNSNTFFFPFARIKF